MSMIICLIKRTAVSLMVIAALAAGFFSGGLDALTKKGRGAALLVVQKGTARVIAFFPH